MSINQGAADWQTKQKGKKLAKTFASVTKIGYICTMIHTGERYINPLTDFGFKRIFGTEFNKELLVSFLNAVLDGERTITDITYNNSERFGSNEASRKAVFDVYCSTSDGGRIIVEMQNVYQEFFKDRSIYYSTFAVSDQARRGDWNYELDDVYTVGILNFALPEGKFRDAGSKCIFKEAKLMDIKTKEVFYDKLTYIYVFLQDFDKPLEECTTLTDKWLFCLRNLSALLERPAALQGRVFENLFRTAEIAKFSEQELRDYEQSVNAYRDIKNGMDTAKKEGLKEGLERGRAEEKKENARKMKSVGIPTTTIQEVTGLTAEEIEAL